MSAAWPNVALGEVIDHRKEFIIIDDLETYRRPRVQLHAQGIVLRDAVPGAQIKTKKQQVARAGEFLVAEIDAKVGGFGIVPDNLDGSIVSSHYFLYGHKPDRLDNKYLGWFVKTRAFRQQVEAQGSTNYAAIRPDDVLRYEIPLPPLDEQRRIVGRIEELAAKVEEARGLRHSLQHEILVLPRALLSQQPSYRKIRVAEFAELRPPNIKVVPLEEYHFAGVYSFGRGVFRGQRKLGSEFAYPKLTRLQVDNFVYPKLMAWEGALGIVPPECDGLVVSTEFPVFEIDGKVMLPEVVDIYFRSPEIWPSLSGQSGGTNVRRRRLNPNDFLNLQMPWPDQATQSVIKQCVSRVSAIGAIQSETAAELDAMVPAILDRAFKGEL
jgi:type I restriction enzyme, S subunit